jgi:hypothetical protein
MFNFKKQKQTSFERQGCEHEQVVERLLSKHETLDSILSTTETKQNIRKQSRKTKMRKHLEKGFQEGQ